MNLHRAIILNGLQELSNDSAAGRRCQVTFLANGQEHWFQCTPEQLNMDWPFASAPAQSDTFRACFGQGMQIQGWEPDSYVTVFPDLKDVDSLIAAIDRVFQEVYGLGPDYVLTYSVQDA